MKTIIYDMNNVFMRTMSNDISGYPLESIIQEIEACSSYPIMVWDGRNALQARRQIYPEYKKNREEKGENIYAAMRNLKEALKYVRGMQVEIPGYEGDDVIAKLVNDDHSIEVEAIRTTDMDLATLGLSIDKEPEIEAEWIPFYKTLVGDPSDNIPGLKGFGKKSWEKLTQSQLLSVRNYVVKGNNFDPNQIPDSLSKKMTPEVVNELRRFYQIVKFLDIPDDMFNDEQTVLVGVPERRCVNEILQEGDVKWLRIYPIPKKMLSERPYSSSGMVTSRSSAFLVQQERVSRRSSTGF